MCRGRFAALAIAASVINVVFIVPAFPQSVMAEMRPDPNSPIDARATMGVARMLDADQPADSDVALPPNLIVPSTFRRTVDAMLRGSPTFRRQCVRIANAPRITVVIDWFQPVAADRVRARTVLSTSRDGRRYAKVLIRPLDDPVELIAHEIEHVIEQLDDVDLPALAAVPTSGVRACDCPGAGFETIRAVRTGLAAADEVRRHGT
jgi:hypothetical protein